VHEAGGRRRPADPDPEVADDAAIGITWRFEVWPIENEEEDEDG